MFSMRQKVEIAKAVEKVLLDVKHPEMPKEKPMFTLHVLGKEAWSFADIKPNWVFEDGIEKPLINQFNEMQDAKR